MPLHHGLEQRPPMPRPIWLSSPFRIYVSFRSPYRYACRWFSAEKPCSDNKLLFSSLFLLFSPIIEGGGGAENLRPGVTRTLRRIPLNAIFPVRIDSNPSLVGYQSRREKCFAMMVNVVSKQDVYEVVLKGYVVVWAGWRRLLKEYSIPVGKKEQASGGNNGTRKK